MKIKTEKLLLTGICFLFLFSFLSCKEKLITEESESAAPLSSKNLKASVILPGRTLAANCFQCHGTNGYAGELKIASMSASEITSKINYYRSQSPGAGIMNVHALAYTPSEIASIADFFSKQ